jgi:hydroxymethylpyrimidine pyrophosphatase-like HAD family hydrolase
MQNDLKNFETLLSPDRIKNLRENGAIFFDVDDTLLARRKNAGENDQNFSESSAAALVPLLLGAGVRVCVITGHGWAQLERRFVTPLREVVTKHFPANADRILQRFFVYANRGATKVVLKKKTYAEDENYGNKYFLERADSRRLREIFRELADFFDADFAKRKDFYLQNFPKFAFDELPPKIIEREKVVLCLRPIPSETHGETDFSESPREKLFESGSELLKEAKLDDKYELTQSGKSTLEITKRTISKKVAFQDLLFQIAEEKEISPERVEESSIYVGDEFSSDGNDYVIAQNFPRALCLSVAPKKCENISANVLCLDEICGLEGVAGTAFLIAHMLKFLT